MAKPTLIFVEALESKLKAVVANDAVDAARKNAEKDCEDKKNCCKKITVDIFCVDPDVRLIETAANRRERRDRGQPNLSTEPKCGNRYTLNCDTMEWKKEVKH